jgi:hypothetical protein
MCRTANTLSMSFTSTGTVKFAGAFPLNTLAGATMEFYIKPAANSSEMDFLWTRTDGSDANRFNMGVTGTSTSRSIFLDYRDPNGVQHILAGIPISGTGITSAFRWKTLLPRCQSCTSCAAASPG